MSTAVQKDIETILKPYEAQLNGIVRKAWKDWRSSPYAGKWRCKRSIACFVWEQMIQHAHVTFAGDKNVKIIPAHESFHIVVGHDVSFRFKKGDESGLSKNIGTELALAYHDPQQDIPGLPLAPRVEVVYQMNKLETDIKDVLVVARDGDSVAWSYSIGASGSVVQPMPQNPKPPVPKDAKKLVKPKDQPSVPTREEM